MFRGGIEADEQILNQRIEVPKGYRFTLFASGLPNARFMLVTSQGDILLSTPRSGEVHFLKRDSNSDGVADESRVLLSGLRSPHGMDFYEDWLYVAEKHAIGRIKFDAATGEVTGRIEYILEGLPEGGNHSNKTIRFGPDGWLYLNIGSSCNVCIEEDERRAAISRMKPDGSEFEIYAKGLRNSVGFDWSPIDGALYATNNGRDMLGDDFPPEELNRVEKGKFYGWPYVNSTGILDPDFGDQGGEFIDETVYPVHSFPAHNAPLGMTFLKSNQHPENFRNNAIVALHGSWNRSQKDGYKVVRLRWNSDGTISRSDFVTGFLKEGNVIGRPVDVVEGLDGAIYVSDDFSGSVYRIAYDEEG